MSKNPIKVFSMLSVRKDLWEKIRDHIFLTIALSNTTTDTKSLATESLIRHGQNPENFVATAIDISHDITDLLPPVTRLLLDQPKSDTLQQKKIKEVGEIVNSVKYAFDKVGTKAEKLAAERVCLKFAESFKVKKHELRANSVPTCN